MANLPLQARAGQNAPFPWGPQVHTRGHVLGPVEIFDSPGDQTLIEAVDEPILLASAEGGAGAPQMGSTTTSDTPPWGGVGRLVAAGGDVVATVVGSLIFSPLMLSAVPAVLTLASGSAFLLAPGEKIVFRNLGAGSKAKGRFYPNAGYIPQDPSELKPYRIDLADGKKHLIAQAPPGKVLVPARQPGGLGVETGGWGLVWSSDLGSPELRFYLDGDEISLLGLSPGDPSEFSMNPIVFPGGAVLVLPAGSKLEAQVTGAAPGSRIYAMLSLRMENG